MRGSQGTALGVRTLLEATTMRLTQPWIRRFRVRALVCVLSGSLASPTVHAASQVGGVRELHGKAEAEIRQARAVDSQAAAKHYAAAARLYAQVAAQIPESTRDRQVRDELLGKAVNSAFEAHRLDSTDFQPLRDALAIVIRHIDELDRTYGEVAASLPEHLQAKRRLELLRTRLREAPADTPTPTESGSPTELTTTPAPAQPVSRPTAPRPTPPVSTPAPRPRGSAVVVPTWQPVGLGVSLGLLGVSVGAAVGTSLAITRKPFVGRLYGDIIQAAVANGIPQGTGDDMCKLGREMAVVEVVDACDARDRAARAAVAMTVLTVVFTASAAAFAALIVRSKRSQRTAPVALGLSSLPGGAFVGASGRF